MLSDDMLRFVFVYDARFADALSPSQPISKYLGLFAEINKLMNSCGLDKIAENRILDHVTNNVTNDVTHSH